MTTRFDYLSFDALSIFRQKTLKAFVECLETKLEEITFGQKHREMSFVQFNAKKPLEDYHANALRALEEFYMWTGKLLREEQTLRISQNATLKDYTDCKQDGEKKNGHP